MPFFKKDQQRYERRQRRVRNAVKATHREMRPRVSVFRSLSHIYAQIIDDNAQKTVAACSSLELKLSKGDKKEKAHAVGIELAKRAKQHGVELVVFDRGAYKYHGRVARLAEGLREGGIQF
jgi:large subunit ribosomal protein L18